MAQLTPEMTGTKEAVAQRFLKAGLDLIPVMIAAAPRVITLAMDVKAFIDRLWAVRNSATGPKQADWDSLKQHEAALRAKLRNPAGEAPMENQPAPEPEAPPAPETVTTTDPAEPKQD